ncbi:MAG: YciI family protein [Thermomicrobiales bacterium]
MVDYLISVIDDGQADMAGANSSATAKEMAAVDVFNDRLREQGYWVYANGLAAPEAATVIDNRGDASIITDGPFLETKEFVAGFWIIKAPNLDVALALAADGSKACNRRVEVRPAAEEPA